MKFISRCLFAMLLLFTCSLSAYAEDAAPSSSAASVAVSKSVDINTADAQTIAAAGLKGIGQKRADAIVAYRQQHGAYKSLNDLTNVKGISQKVIDANRAMLTLT